MFTKIEIFLLQSKWMQQKKIEKKIAENKKEMAYNQMMIEKLLKEQEEAKKEYDDLLSEMSASQLSFLLSQAEWSAACPGEYPTEIVAKIKAELLKKLNSNSWCVDKPPSI